VKLLTRRAPHARTIRPAEPYLAAGAEEARRSGHGFVGTEHLLLALLHKPGATPLLARLGVERPAAEQALRAGLPGGEPKIDARALAALGIDFETVREHVEQAFGPGALERTHAGCLGVAPAAKRALAHALECAGDEPLADEHVVIGLLSVPDSPAARVLGVLGVTAQSARTVLGGRSAR
jgi:ATP-dependent Clp protease ATP-binding subunit ClpA